MRADKRLHVSVPRLKNQSQKNRQRDRLKPELPLCSPSYPVALYSASIALKTKPISQPAMAPPAANSLAATPGSLLWCSIRPVLHVRNTLFVGFKRLFNGSGPFFQPQMKFSGCNFISRASNQRRFRQFLPGSKARRGYCRTQFIRRYLRWRKSREVSL